MTNEELEAMAQTLRAAGYRVTGPQPLKLQDLDGDIWYLLENGNYSMVQNNPRPGAGLTHEQVAEDWGPMIEVTE